MTSLARFGAIVVAAAIPLVAIPATAAAQATADTAAAKRPAIGPPVRRIATAAAVSTETLGTVNGILELRDGRVLVNDGQRRRLLLMDTTLSKVEVVLDSLAEIANTYGTRPGGLLPFRGDSALFIDPVSYAMLVLDPSAKIARVRSVWRVSDMFNVTAPGGMYGWPGADAKGRIVYRVAAQPAPPKVAPPPGVPYFPPDPDSAFIVATDIDTRRTDTIGVIHIPKNIYQVKQTSEGYFSIVPTVNPLPSTDEWAVLPDGAVAFIRGRDYRVEYRAPDGTWTSSAKLPFDWQRVTQDIKEHLIDSVKSANLRLQMSGYVSSMIRWANTYNKPYPASFKVPDGYVPAPGMMKDWKLPPQVTLPANYIYGCAPGVEPTMIAGGAPGVEKTAVVGPAGAAATDKPVVPAPVVPQGMPGVPGPLAGRPSCIPAPIMIGGGITPPPPQMREINVVPANELPDYRPPFSTGAARADADGNLWVRTNPSKPVPGGPVFDVVNRQGELVDRIQLLPGYTIAGFGKGRVVYVTMRDARGIHLARVRLK